ncbi:MAG: hypothetical protein LCH41_07270 [Armatimonadetes bacterium]|jgi:hypothetical protein|nr:hypothetical protein [Armatimonadota bacterium]
MQNLPEWWLTVSGVFFFLGSIALGVLMVVSIVLVWLLLDLRKNIQILTLKVQALTDRADAIAKNVQGVTEEVGVRTKGIARVVDEHASTAFGIIEKLAPLFVGLGLVSRIMSLLRSRRV